MKELLDQLADWWGWRLLGALAVCLLVGVVFYTAYAIHQHSDQLTCINRGFNQVLNEALNHARLRPPPDC